MTADQLSNQFSSVFVIEPDSILPPFEPRTDHLSILDLYKLTPFEINRALKKLDTNKSIGYDGVSPRLLKECAESLSIPLSIIFARSLNTSTVPKAWKIANITPIYKGGIKTNPANYRPISLTSTTCRVFERIIKEHMMDFLMEHKLLSPHQHGFVKSKSCLTNLLETIDLITSGINAKKAVDVVYMDYAKAFDKVPHNRLIHKIERYGFHPSITKWLKAFTTCRKQRVVQGEEASDFVEVKSGVAQGSVLGPLLFLLYVNDLPEKITFPIKLYADDNKIIATMDKPDSQSILQNDLNTMLEWSNTWLMDFNFSKCLVMHFGNNNQKFVYHLDSNTNLRTSEVERDLGILISNDLKWSNQVTFAANKAHKILTMIENTFHNLNINTLSLLYKALVRPHLDYCAQVYSPYLKKDIDTLENVQKRATKLVPQLTKLDYDARLAKLNLQPLKDRRVRGDLIEMYKIVNGHDIVNWQNPLCWNSERTLENNQGSTGRHHKHRIIREIVPNCQARHNFLPNRVSQAWNRLNPTIVYQATPNSFKNALDNDKSYLSFHYF